MCDRDRIALGSGTLREPVFARPFLAEARSVQIRRGVSSLITIDKFSI